MALVTFKELQIGQILGPTHGALVPDQQRLAENTDWQLIDFAADLCGKASSFGTPEILVKRSIRCGTRPSWINWPCSRKSVSVNWEGPKPNCFSTSASLAALSGAGRMRISRSPVKRGLPWNARLCAPTIR